MLQIKIKNRSLKKVGLALVDNVEIIIKVKPQFYTSYFGRLFPFETRWTWTLLQDDSALLIIPISVKQILKRWKSWMTFYGLKEGAAQFFVWRCFEEEFAVKLFFYPSWSLFGPFLVPFWSPMFLFFDREVLVLALLFLFFLFLLFSLGSKLIFAFFLEFHHVAQY